MGVLMNPPNNQLRQFTMTDEHATGSKHIVEAINRLLNDINNCGPLPLTLFLQLDKGMRGNKNKLVMSYIEFLIYMKLFDTVEVRILPAGHTQTDIDQAFSTTSRKLHVHDTIIIQHAREVSQVL